MQVNIVAQQRRFGDDTFGDGSFGWVPLSKMELSLIVNRIVTENLQINVIVNSSHKKKFTGLWRADHKWSKAKGGCRNIFFDPEQRDDSIVAIVEMIADINLEMTGNKATTFSIEETLDTEFKNSLELGSNIKINNINVLCS